MSTSDRPDGPPSPPAFSAGLADLPEERARELVESDEYPEPDPREERWEAETAAVRLAEDGDVIVYDTEQESAWIQSDVSATLEGAR